MEEILIATRSMNDELYAMSGSLINYPLRRVQIRNTEADTYFLEIMRLDAEWVINLDEDAFAWDWNGIMGLQQHMSKNGFVCCGMPDGGVITDRSHNPTAVNAFFNIIHVGRLREEFAVEAVRSAEFSEDLKGKVPAHMLRTGRFEYDEFEPYYRFFFWLLRAGFQMLYLDAVQWARDPVSTLLLDQTGAPLLIHCWYARAFNEQRARFMHAFEYCRKMSRNGREKSFEDLWNHS